MKKYHLVISVAVCLFAANVRAQSNPIDDFLKKYPSREGVTNVSVSKQMLEAIFAPPPTKNTSRTREEAFWYVTGEDMNVPEAYSSVSISKTDKAATMFADFKKTLLSAKYEQYMEVNREDSNMLTYYLKKVNDQSNEVVVLRQRKDQFSAIYLKGDIDINRVDRYLIRIKSALARMEASSGMQPGFHTDFEFNFNPQFLGDLQCDISDLQNRLNFSFDSEKFQQNMENVRRNMEETMKKAMDKAEEAAKKAEEEKEAKEEPEK